MNDVESKKDVEVKNEPLNKRMGLIEEKLKKYTLVGTLAGVLLGGGGVFGAVQWFYQAPLDKKIKTYESAIASLKGVIEASNKGGASAEEAKALRMELIALDRDYRNALGLVAECMEILATRGIDKEWLQKAARQLQALEQQRPPVSEKAVIPDK
ncbi:hypothetical protein SG34_005245 [Thalassomonas viridans]|uniref:Uncharacterized protein n=1 Tax=Thalassomonas viridans TaxID=137584 RepID=A0AAF0CAI0_9GAMM|nr:hypothetical protein [Thalassomonas viridans]WDE06330.1 hypothetical protein SG34_005245 [Thalassomonas viridans]